MSKKLAALLEELEVDGRLRDAVAELYDRATLAEDRLADSEAEIERLRDDVRQLEDAMEINMDNSAAAAAQSMRERANEEVQKYAGIDSGIKARLQRSIYALPLIEEDKLRRTQTLLEVDD